MQDSEAGQDRTRASDGLGCLHGQTQASEGIFFAVQSDEALPQQGEPFGSWIIELSGRFNGLIEVRVRSDLIPTLRRIPDELPHERGTPRPKRLAARDAPDWSVHGFAGIPPDRGTDRSWQSVKSTARDRSACQGYAPVHGAGPRSPDRRCQDAARRTANIYINSEHTVSVQTS